MKAISFFNFHGCTLILTHYCPIQLLYIALASQLVYDIGVFVKAAREDEVIHLNFPPYFPVDSLQKFKDSSIDFTNDFGGTTGDGLAFDKVVALLCANKDQMELTGMLGLEQMEHLEKTFAQIEGERQRKRDGGEYEDTDSLFLSTYRSFQQKVSCVYGVFKDK